jgi:hypothetical protein
MQALVHFVVGLGGALFLLSFLDRPAHEEVLLSVVSGFWALWPDGYWLLRELGVGFGTGKWQAIHRSVLSNLFWFHGLIDSLETGHAKLQAGIALTGLVAVVAWHYLCGALRAGPIR